MPFGQPPAAPPAAVVAAVPVPPPPAFANKLVLCAVNRSQTGTASAGFVDGSQNPPRNYYLDLGDSQDGFTIMAIDVEGESATIEKDGTSLTLTLPGSNRKVITPKEAAILAAATKPPEKKPDTAERLAKAAPVEPMFKTATEQLLSMELSVPSGTESPPLPITSEMEPDVHKALSSVIVIATNDTDSVATHKETIGWAKEEMRQHLTTGGSTASYLQTLKSRRDAEIARQKAARLAAEAQIRELAKKMTQTELENQLEVINKNLTDNGVEPIDAPE